MSLYVENSILVTSCAWLRGRLFNFNSQCSLWLLWKDSLSCWNLIIHIPCLTMITIIVSQNELVHNVESLVKLNFHIPSPRFTHLNVCCSLVTFGNTHKVDTKATMNEIKMINQHWSWCTMPPLSKEKENKNNIKLRGSQVALYVNQQGRIKQKSRDLCSNWLGVLFNLVTVVTFKTLIFLPFLEREGESDFLLFMDLTIPSWFTFSMRTCTLSHLVPPFRWPCVVKFFKLLLWQSGVY